MKTQKQLLEQISRYAINFNENTNIHCVLILTKTKVSIDLYSETILFSEIVYLNQEKTIKELKELIIEIHELK